jgi:hypothetical protein
MADILKAELIIKRGAAVGIRNQHNLAVVIRVFNRRPAETDMPLYKIFKTIRFTVFAYLELSGFL